MNKLYTEIITKIVYNFIDGCLDSDIYNKDSLKKLVVNEYIERYNFDEFINEVEEQIENVLEDTFRIKIDS